MTTRVPENVPTREEIEQGRVIIPGYVPICEQCIFKDYYLISKGQATLINNLRDQLLAVTQEMETLKSQLESQKVDEKDE